VPSFTLAPHSTLQELHLDCRVLDFTLLLVVDLNAFVPLTGRLRSFSLHFLGHVFGLAPALSSALLSSLVKLSVEVRAAAAGVAANGLGMSSRDGGISPQHTSACSTLLPAVPVSQLPARVEVPTLAASFSGPVNSGAWCFCQLLPTLERRAPHVWLGFQPVTKRACPHCHLFHVSL
jgi:hypothetical protein